MPGCLEGTIINESSYLILLTKTQYGTSWLSRATSSPRRSPSRPTPLLTRAPPGSPAEHASPGGGGNIYPPPVISGTQGRRGAREAAIESSRQDDSNQYL